LGGGEVSGGHYDYAYHHVNDFVWTMEARDDMTDERKALARLLKAASEAMRMVEWVDSGDCSPGDENAAIAACFKVRP
jgi:hypothetical protein